MKINAEQRSEIVVEALRFYCDNYPNPAQGAAEIQREMADAHADRWATSLPVVGLGHEPVQPLRKPAKGHFVVNLDRSDALAESTGLPDGHFMNVITLDARDGAWVGVTYEALRNQDGDAVGITFGPNNKIWWKGEPYSDMVIEWVDGPPVRYQARFVPQAWIGDQAIEIDPAGPVSVWDVTDTIASWPDDYRTQFLARFDTEDDFEILDADDHLRDDPKAPQWVRDHNGPFSIWVSISTEGN